MGAADRRLVRRARRSGARRLPRTLRGGVRGRARRRDRRSLDDRDAAGRRGGGRRAASDRLRQSTLVRADRGRGRARSRAARPRRAAARRARRRPSDPRRSTRCSGPRSSTRSSPRRRSLHSRNSGRSVSTAAESPRRPRAVRWKLVAFVVLVLAGIAGLVARLTQVQLVEGPSFAAAARANQIHLIPLAAPRGLHRRSQRHGHRAQPAVVRLRAHPVGGARHRRHAARAGARCSGRRGVVVAAAATIISASTTTLRSGRDLRAVRAGHPRRRPLARANGAAGRERIVDSRRRFRRAAGPQLPADTRSARTSSATSARSPKTNIKRARIAGYSPNDVVGKDGLEQTLRRAGCAARSAASRSRSTRRQPRPPARAGRPGPGNTLSTDDRLAAAAHRRHELAGRTRNARQAARPPAGRRRRRHRPRDGGVLALASFPDFDPERFRHADQRAKFARYLTDPLQPLYDRAIGAASPTGSTFKMVTGSRRDLAPASSGRIRSSTIPARGSVTASLSATSRGRARHDRLRPRAGRIDRTATSTSSAYRLGHDRLRYYALQYGLDQILGVDLPGEFAGNWPTNEWSMRVYGKDFRSNPAMSASSRSGRVRWKRRRCRSPMSRRRRQRRDALPAAHRRGDPHPARARSSSAFDHEIIRKVDVTAGIAARSQAGMDKVTDPAAPPTAWPIPGLPYRRQDGHRRNRRAAAARTRPGSLRTRRRPADGRAGGLHGAKRRLRREVAARSHSTSSPTTSARRSPPSPAAKRPASRRLRKKAQAPLISPSFRRIERHVRRFRPSSRPPRPFAARHRSGVRRCSAARDTRRRRGATSSISRSASPTSTRPSTSRRRHRGDRGELHALPPIAGFLELRDCIAAYATQFRGIEPFDVAENVVVAAGCQADHLESPVRAARSGRRDGLRRSGLSDYAAAAGYLGASAVPVPLLEIKQLRPRPRRTCRQGHAAHQSPVINCPNNPTGGVLTRDDLAAIADLAEK